MRLFNKKKETIPRMSRSYCPCCNSYKNTFKVDSYGYLIIKICLDCSREQKFPIDTSKSKNCLKCGETYLPLKSLICPVCWVHKFKLEDKKND